MKWLWLPLILCLGVGVVFGVPLWWLPSMDLPAVDKNLSVAQNVFILFYAIFWGFVSEVSPRWKKFNWAVALKLDRTCLRALSATAFFITVPIALFFWFFNVFQYDAGGYPVSVIPALLAAHAPFGLYRLWIGLIELFPHRFYYRHQELQDLSLPGLLDGGEPSFDGPEGSGGLNLHREWAVPSNNSIRILKTACDLLGRCFRIAAP